MCHIVTDKKCCQRTGEPYYHTCEYCPGDEPPRKRLEPSHHVFSLPVPEAKPEPDLEKMKIS